MCEGFFWRIYTSGQQTHEKGHLTSLRKRKRKPLWTQPECLPSKGKKQQVLARLERNWSPLPLLESVQNAVSASKHILALPHNAKHRVIMWPSDSVPRCMYPRELKTYVPRKTWTQMFLVAMFVATIILDCQKSGNNLMSINFRGK